MNRASPTEADRHEWRQVKLLGPALYSCARCGEVAYSFRREDFGCDPNRKGELVRSKHLGQFIPQGRYRR